MREPAAAASADAYVFRLIIFVRLSFFDAVPCEYCIRFVCVCRAYGGAHGFLRLFLLYCVAVNPRAAEPYGRGRRRVFFFQKLQQHGRCISAHGKPVEFHA